MSNEIVLEQEEVNEIARRLDEVLWDNASRIIESVLLERGLDDWELSDDDIIRIKERMILIL